jgi:hypothetical protein
VNHLEVKRLSFIDVIQVFHGNYQAQFKNGQAWKDQQSKMQARLSMFHQMVMCPSKKSPNNDLYP